MSLDEADPDLDFDAAGARERLIEAAHLFDAGEYHDAHEAWEVLWLANEGADADFFKGLIQAAICLHHWRDGDQEGARMLYRGHRRYLAPYLPEHRGVDVAAFLDAMRATLDPLLRARPGELLEFPGGGGPRVPFVEDGANP
jgi:predicted metal-dependent hydrolase